MRVFLSYIFITLQLMAVAQSSNPEPPFDKLTREDYIDLFAPFAVQEMLISGVPASITLAQGILESGDGNSVLAREANNHFGIKCHGMWDGNKYYMDDDAKNECFRVYESVFDSYHDHSDFLAGRDRYADLFKLKRTDYKGWAHGLKQAGYATNPKYPSLLIKIIEENSLHKYDLMKSPPESKGKEGKDKGKDKDRNRDKQNSENPKEAIVSTGRQMYLRNNIRYVRVKEGDDFKKLEKALQVREWQILKYNDKAKGAKLVPGELIYLQPKRGRSWDHDYHEVKEGESLRWISQEYGVKLSKLYKFNDLNPGEEPVVGQRIWLRKRKRSEY
ncbi:MAG: LysM peptidoglycan-binding domain-containing protein [Flavobacteriales bacterium]|nr:LysM peptidoglycan-binding domain-containing protein [Flavobacteriales bacterium]